MSDLDDQPPSSEIVVRLSRLFWDCRLSARHLQENTLWVIERVLEYGNLDDVQLLVGLFGRAAFLQFVSQARFFSCKTRAFWEQMLEREGLTCTRKFSRGRVATSWLCSSG